MKNKRKPWKIIRQKDHIHEPFEYTYVFKEKGFTVDERVEEYLKSDMIQKMGVSGFRQRTDLIVYSVAELGFPKGATYEEILYAGIRKGLDFCEPAIGLTLRRLYKNQPVGEKLYVAMFPLERSCMGIFGVINTEYLPLGICIDSGLAIFHQPHQKFVFATQEFKNKILERAKPLIDELRTMDKNAKIQIGYEKMSAEGLLYLIKDFYPVAEGYLMDWIKNNEKQNP